MANIIKKLKLDDKGNPILNDKKEFEIEEIDLDALMADEIKKQVNEQVEKLAEGKIYFSKNLDVYKTFNDKEILVKKNGYLYQELFNCINNEKTNIRDEKPGVNKLDMINAAECCFSYFRFKLFKN